VRGNYTRVLILSRTRAFGRAASKDSRQARCPPSPLWGGWPEQSEGRVGAFVRTGLQPTRPRFAPLSASTLPIKGREVARRRHHGLKPVPEEARSAVSKDGPQARCLPLPLWERTTRRRKASSEVRGKPQTRCPPSPLVGRVARAKRGSGGGIRTYLTSPHPAAVRSALRVHPPHQRGGRPPGAVTTLPILILRNRSTAARCIWKPTQAQYRRRDRREWISTFSARTHKLNNRRLRRRQNR